MPDREHGDEIDRLIACSAARDAAAEARALAARAETARLLDEVGRLEGEVAARKPGTGIEFP